MNPLRDWMLVEKYEHTKSLIHTPETVKDKADNTTAYKVLAVGPGYWDQGRFHVPTTKVGDIIIMEGQYVADFIYKGQVYLGVQDRYVAFAERSEDGRNN